MSLSAENDQTMTNDPSPEKEKKKSGLVGIISIVSSILIILVAVIFPDKESSTYSVGESRALLVDLEISSPSFLIGGASNVCAGSGKYKGINTSTLQVKSSKWNESFQIPSGTLNSQGVCIYPIKLFVNNDFAGGNVRFNVHFPFGDSPDYVNVVPAAPPFGKIQIQITLN